MPSALVALSSFKGSLSNLEACEIVRAAFVECGFEAEACPVGDGGAGTLDAVQAALGGTLESVPAEDPTGRAISTRVLRIQERYYVESAETCGLILVEEERREPMRASSYGLGVVLAELFGRNPESVYVGLGDSGVSDAGLGILKSLGFRFVDRAGASVWANAEGLRQIAGWQSPPRPPWSATKVTVLCDVLNPVCGPSGTARVYAPQKGASREQVTLIERGMETLCDALKRETGHDFRHEPMTGAAGGLGLAFRAFLRADLKHGAGFFLDWIGFDKRLEKHSLLIIGEGCTDAQTLQGKAVAECVARARGLGKKIAILSGSLGPGHEPLTSQEHIIAIAVTGREPTPQRALFEQAKALALSLK